MHFYKTRETLNRLSTIMYKPQVPEGIELHDAAHNAAEQVKEAMRLEGLRDWTPRRSQDQRLPNNSAGVQTHTM